MFLLFAVALMALFAGLACEFAEDEESLLCENFYAARSLALRPIFGRPTMSPTPQATVYEHIEQVTHPPQKKANSRKKEEDLACKELDCYKTKCASLTSSIEISRCKRKCAQERCDARCKDEPKPSYVERELKLEKCVEDCLEDEKCKSKCQDEARSCKLKCPDKAKQYFCVRPLSLLNQGDADEAWAASVSVSTPKDASLSDVEKQLAEESDVI